jgi:hypothetical protein
VVVVVVVVVEENKRSRCRGGEGNERDTEREAMAKYLLHQVVKQLQRYPQHCRIA